MTGSGADVATEKAAALNAQRTLSPPHDTPATPTFSPITQLIQVMPFDPNIPANNAALNSSQIRGQLTSLHNDIQSRATMGQLVAHVGTSSSNSNAVNTLGLAVSDPPTQGELQSIADKLDELINALRR